MKINAKRDARDDEIEKNMNTFLFFSVRFPQSVGNSDINEKKVKMAAGY